MESVKLIIVAGLTFFFIQWLRPVALKVGLVDYADGERKLHAGSIPLIGGIAMYLGFIVGFLPTSMYYKPHFFWGIGIPFSIIIIIGVLDDLKSLSVKSRFFFQIIAVLIAAYIAEIQLDTLGNLLGWGEIQLHAFAVPFTVLAVIGMINAYNMMDGIDGLAGSLALISFASIAWLIYMSGSSVEGATLGLLFVGLLIPFLIENLTFFSAPSRKIFMGDAGSMFLGFAIGILLIYFSQGNQQVFHPVTALWITAVPLMDTIAIIVRRLLDKKSPFQADREHLHHLFLRAGYSHVGTLSIIVGLSVICAATGISGEWLEIPQWIMFLGFLGLFALYFYFIIRHPWKTSLLIKLQDKKKETPQAQNCQEREYFLIKDDKSSPDDAFSDQRNM